MYETYCRSHINRSRRLPERTAAVAMKPIFHCFEFSSCTVENKYYCRKFMNMKRCIFNPQKFCRGLRFSRRLPWCLHSLLVITDDNKINKYLIIYRVQQCINVLFRFNNSRRQLKNNK